MIHLVMFNVLFVVLSWGSLGYAQGVSENPERNALGKNPSGCATPPYCSDAQRNALGELINQDYFVAKLDPDTSKLLSLVEIFHLNKIWPNLKDGRFEAALPDIRYTLNRFPNHPKGLLLMGMYARLSKAFAMAIPYYEKALRFYPQYALIHAQYGAYLVDIGRSNEGIAKLKKAIEIDPKLAPAYAWLAKAYAKNGNLELARQAAERATEHGSRGKGAVQLPEE